MIRPREPRTGRSGINVISASGNQTNLTRGCACDLRNFVRQAVIVVRALSPVRSNGYRANTTKEDNVHTDLE
ncbi:hypothetical protein NOGI109294_02370 [Nocardiopsis gilva]